MAERVKLLLSRLAQVYQNYPHAFEPMVWKLAEVKNDARMDAYLEELVRVKRKGVATDFLRGATEGTPMTVTAYQLIRYDKSGRILRPHFAEVFFRTEDAEREKRYFEADWGIARWFGHCEIKKVQIDKIGEQRVLGVAGGRRTVYNLRRDGRMIYGVIKKQRKDGKRGRDFDGFAVWYNPETNRWYLVNPDRFRDEYCPKFKSGGAHE